EEDRVGGHERKFGPAQRLLHRPETRVHRDAAEHVHDLPRIGNVSVEAAGVGSVGREARVVTNVVRHRTSLRSPPMEPRLEPLPYDEWDAETKAIFAEPTLNIFGTLARHPKLLKRWLVFGNHVLAKSTLSARDRELLILRAGWRC